MELLQNEYDKRWIDLDYSAESIGYTADFLKFMGRWSSIRPCGCAAVDIGCGDGYFSGKLRRLGYEVSGIDISPVAIDKASKEHPECKFIIHDLSRPLPFHDNSFNLAWCSENLEHLFSPFTVLKEIYRILQPRGRLLCTVPYHGLVKNIGIAIFAFERHYDPTYPHIRFFTKKSLSKIIEAAGFKIRWAGTCGSNLGLRDLFIPTNILMCAEKKVI